MMEDPYAPLRQMMAQVISVHVAATAETTEVEALDPRVLEVMERVPRHEFVPAEFRAYAHADGPLPIGCNKTISQPFITALMTTLLGVEKTDRVLEVGTGLGYHSAVLCQLAERVYSVEIIEELLDQARQRLESLALTNLETRLGNGYNGWPENAPYDKILVAAAAELIPPPLIGQLKSGGRMVLPTGIEDSQQLMVVDKGEDGRVRTREILAVRFAPMEES